MGRCCTIIKGSLVRIVFSLLGGLSVWLVSGEDGRRWMLWVVFLLLMFMEGAYTLGVKKHGSWKWFSPTIALLLACTVPCLWLIEWEMYTIRKKCAHGASSCDRSIFNNTSLPPIFGHKVKMNLLEMPLPDWALVLHQAFLFALILGRWLLPKGELSRDQLSQLLLVQIGMAADILEFVTEGLKADEIFDNNVHILVLLGVWTWSLPQFTLSLTLTKGRKRRVAGVVPLAVKPVQVKMEEERPGRCHCFCGTEVWAILVTLIMQDLPFLGTRLYLIFSPKVPLSVPFFFFTFKNALLSILQLYRLAVILQEYWAKRNARAAMSVESSRTEIVELGDVTAVRVDESVPGPRNNLDSATTTSGVWFTSRFLHIIGRQEHPLRHRKHAGIQTEWSPNFDDDSCESGKLSTNDRRRTANSQEGWGTAFLESGVPYGRDRDCSYIDINDTDSGVQMNSSLTGREGTNCDDEVKESSGVDVGMRCVPTESSDQDVGEFIPNDEVGLYLDAVDSTDEAEELSKSSCEIVANVDEFSDGDCVKGGESCHDGDGDGGSGVGGLGGGTGDDGDVDGGVG